MLIVQISDTHIDTWGKKTFGIAPMAENLKLCIDDINRLEPEPDLVVITGDIVNAGHRDAADRAAKILKQLRYPLYIVPGNHDDRSHLWATFGGGACPSRTGEFINYVVDGFDVRLIGVDSTIPSASGGEICSERAQWLDAKLAKGGDKPTIIFMHHPPINCGVPETDIDGFIGADLLGDVIEKYSNIERVICGHIHLPVHARWRGTIVSTAPSMGMQLTLDLTKRRPSGFILAAPGYQLHYWIPGLKLVTHTVYVHEAEGPYPFEEQQA